ncbi:MAG: hypothetical protein Q9162_002528 [Coniocarpon cinnabarinum]
MDELAQNLLASLKKPSLPLDSKLTLFNSLKSNIKHQRVPESAQQPTIECVRIAIASQTSSTLVTTGFSTLSHLIKRLTLQDQVHAIFSPRINVLGALLDRLGDPKENHRSAASQCLVDLWPARPAEVEKTIRESAILGSNVRMKDIGMQWVMHTEESLPFKSFVPPLVDCLNHADGTIRERAKLTLIDLFRNASDRAKADLTRQLIAKGVRKSIAAHILSQLHISAPQELSSSTATTHAPARPETPYQEPVPDSKEVALPPSQEVTHIEPLYISSQRELDEVFRTMQPFFEGRETEGNWMQRDNSVLKLRRYLKGNTPEDYNQAFTGHIRHMLDGLLKVVNSLRTTMSSNGCQLVQELARTLGPAIDPMVELLMQNMMKLCSATKNIAAQNGNSTVEVLLSNVSYNVRLVQHVWQAVQDKNSQPRTFAAGWLKTLMRRQTHNRIQFEHSGGLELVEKSIKKGLSDANPKVRETMRGAFWAFEQIWHERGEAIMNTLDAKSRQLLEKDSANPNSAQSSFTSSVGPGAANPRVAASNARLTLKDTIAAQKKAALAAKRMPDRPNSAMANLSPAKEATRPATRAPAGTVNPTSRAQVSASAHGPSSRPIGTTSSGVSHGSLMSGPVRRPKRPEVPRPATADPYANRQLLRAESPPSRESETSPGMSASKSSAISSTLMQKKAHPSSRPGTSGTDTSSRVASPRVSPVKQRPRTIHGANSLQASTPRPQTAAKIPSPSPGHWPTAVAPGVNETIQGRPTPRSHGMLQSPNEHSKPDVNDVNAPMIADEDNFTLVMPPDLGSNEIRNVQMNNELGPEEVSTIKPAQTLPNQPTQSEGRDHTSGQDDGDMQRKDEIEVHEDGHADIEDRVVEHEAPQAVLQELTVNEQSLPEVSATNENEDGSRNTADDIRSNSPTKNGNVSLMDESHQDRAEIAKNRRILSSGIERLRAKTLDAHGFRRLQDLIKLPCHDSARLMSDLLLVLTGYIEATPEMLKVNGSKAMSLKSQALSVIRNVAALHKGATQIRQQFANVVRATLATREMPQTSPQFAADLERTASEVLKHAGNQLGCILDTVLDFVNTGGANQTSPREHCVTMALSVLNKLQIETRQKSLPLSQSQKQQLGQLAVRLLDDRNPDVRRADTELCLEMFGHFGEEQKEEYWSLLKGAREAQLNLIAYYLARRVQEAR